MRTSLRQTVLSAALLAGIAMPTLALADISTDNTAGMTCQQMMDKAKPMLDQTVEPSTKGLAVKQFDIAKMDMAKGKMTLCKRHMRKAMDLMGASPNTAG